MAAGNGFNVAHPTFEQTCMAPYAQFLERVYHTGNIAIIEVTYWLAITAPSVCKSRALRRNSEDRVVVPQITAGHRSVVGPQQHSMFMIGQAFRHGNRVFQNYDVCYVQTNTEIAIRPK